MIYHLYRDAFSEVYPYRYRLTDPSGALKLLATWDAAETSQPECIHFCRSNNERVGQLHWEDRGWWLGDRYNLFAETREHPQLARIEERWHLVDRLRLQLPRYRIHLMEGNRFEARGRRYGPAFYELFTLPAARDVAEESGVWLGEIVHPVSGPTYQLQTDSPLLTTAPLLLMALVVIVDLWGRHKE